MFVEAWTPQIGDRVQIHLSAECPIANFPEEDGWCSKYPDGSTGVVAARLSDLMTHTDDSPNSIDGHDVFVLIDGMATPDGRQYGGWYAVSEIDPIRALLAQQRAEGPGGGVTNPRELNVVDDWSEVPDFASEAEEQAYWSTHSFGDGILNQMRRVDENGGE